jgi:tetratricopeptide (TPR) repeat protein
MSGSAVLRQDWPDQETIWIYGVVQAVPAKFNGQLTVARLIDAWQDMTFRNLLVAGGVPDMDAEDPTVIVSMSTRPRFHGVPPRIASFAGRAAELDQLDAILGSGRVAVVTQAGSNQLRQIGRAALQGMGGIGKTILAVEYAYRSRDLYAGCWWCTAETRFDLLTSLAGLASDIGAVAKEEADIEKAAKAGLRHLAGRPGTILLIYDNVIAPETIADLLPASGAHLLITSRFADWSEWAEEICLDVLLLPEAAALIQIRAQREDETGAKLLAEALGCLPLALDHAAAYCKRTQMRFSDYAAKTESLILTAPYGMTYPRTVAATFDIAINEAIRQCTAAGPLMDYLAQCAPERIPISLVEGAITDEAKRTAALLALTDMSLVKRDPFEDGTSAITIHRLVQVVARAREEARHSALPVVRRVTASLRIVSVARRLARNSTASATKRVISRLEAIYPSGSYDNPELWPLCARLSPHVLVQYDADMGRTQCVQWAKLLRRVAHYYLGRAAYQRARELLERDLAICEKVQGRDHTDVATLLCDLAVVLERQGDLAGARRADERGLTIREKALGPRHHDTITSMNNLATILSSQGDYTAARQMYERVITALETLHGPEYINVGRGLLSLANVLERSGDYAAIEPLRERALAIVEKTLSPGHPHYTLALCDLARTRQTRGNFDGAQPLIERALASLNICEKAIGSDHPTVADGLSATAGLFDRAGNFSAARPLFGRALEIREKVFGPEHPELAKLLNDFATFLMTNEDTSGARPLLERALRIREKVLGPEHPSTGISVGNLASLLRAQGDLNAAQPLFERAIAIHEKTVGPKHPYTATGLSNLAFLLQKQGNFGAARSLLERALAIYENTRGSEHPETVTCLIRLAHLLEERGDLNGAQPLFERSLALREKTLGSEHLDTMSIRKKLAGLPASNNGANVALDADKG